jgi:hypothetical protein
MRLPASRRQLSEQEPSSAIEVAMTDVGTQCNTRKADNMKIKEETILL